MVFTAFVSLIAGLLTVLAPCVLPLLPVVLGGSVVREGNDRWRPFIITGSLVASLVLFTLLLKASTVFIHVDPRVWTYLSGGIIVVLGVSMLFPGLWSRVAEAVGLERRSQAFLQKAHGHRNKTVSAVLTGAALGPVFSSCSPTYAWAIATVLPASPALGMVYLSVYCVGVGAGLLAVALLGRRFLSRIKWASKPGGAFQRIVASLFIVVGLFIVTGLDQAVETKLLTADPFGITRLEQRLVPTGNGSNAPVEMSPGDVASYPAPELVGIQGWINSDPLTLARLKGKVVLIDFWTYSCINCERTQPYLNAWYNTYRADGFVIIGVHAPEFAFEQVPENVQKAVTADGIKYPVALDNGFETWKAYANNYWPAKYLIDKDGRVRYTQFGEGDYDVTESKIRQLLGESASTKPMVQVTADGPGSTNQTPETYPRDGTRRALRGQTGPRRWQHLHRGERRCERMDSRRGLGRGEPGDHRGLRRGDAHPELHRQGRLPRDGRPAWVDREGGRGLLRHPRVGRGPEQHGDIGRPPHVPHRRVHRVERRGHPAAHVLARRLRQRVHVRVTSRTPTVTP